MKNAFMAVIACNMRFNGWHAHSRPTGVIVAAARSSTSRSGCIASAGAMGVETCTPLPTPTALKGSGCATLHRRRRKLRMDAGRWLGRRAGAVAAIAAIFFISACVRMNKPLPRKADEWQVVGSSNPDGPTVRPTGEAKGP